MVEMPPALEASWHTHGYYGSVSHNVKAIYQRYLGWFDGNPANLWQHPPVERGTRYVDAFGGADAVIAKAQGYIDDGDLRFAAELLNHVVFADETNTTARELLAGVYDVARLRRRERHLAELLPPGRLRAAPRGRVRRPGLRRARPTWSGRCRSVSSSTRWPSGSTGPRAWDEHVTIDWTAHRSRTHLPDRAHQRRPHPGRRSESGTADLTLSLTKPQLLGLLGGAGLDGISTTGDVSVLQTLLGVLDPTRAGFAIVTP